MTLSIRLEGLTCRPVDWIRWREHGRYPYRCLGHRLCYCEKAGREPVWRKTPGRKSMLSDRSSLHFLLLGVIRPAGTPAVAIGLAAFMIVQTGVGPADARECRKN